MSTTSKTTAQVAAEVQQAMDEANIPQRFRVYYSTEANAVLVVIEDVYHIPHRRSVPVSEHAWIGEGEVVCLHTPNLEYYPNARSCYPMFPDLRARKNWLWTSLGRRTS